MLGGDQRSLSILYDDVYCVDVIYEIGEPFPVADCFYEEGYKTLDFGSTPQPVSQQFYEWFTANATKK